MKTLPLLIALVTCSLCAHAADPILAEDDATDGAYKTGWKTDGGGSGFTDWVLQSVHAPSGDSYSGYFIADTAGANADGAAVAIGGKAFGMFANGVSFEVAEAFRGLKKPLAVGQTFSFLMKSGDFVKKFATDDPGAGSVGITLRTGNESASVDDYNKEARFEFGSYAGKPNYQIYDGETTQDSGIPVSDGGVTVSVTLATADTYDLEVTTLADKKKTTLKGRKLGGQAGGAIGSFCIFDRNGEKNDAFFNGFQVTGKSE